MNRTTGPLELSTDGERCIVCREGAGERVAEVVSGNPRADAEFIVRSWNSHEELLSCVRTAFTVIQGTGQWPALTAALSSAIENAEKPLF